MRATLLTLVVTIFLCNGCTSLPVKSAASETPQVSTESVKNDAETKACPEIKDASDEAVCLCVAVQPDFHPEMGSVFEYETKPVLECRMPPFKVVQAQFTKEENEDVGTLYYSRVEDFWHNVCFIVVSKYQYCDDEELCSGQYMYIGSHQYETRAKFTRTVRVFADLDIMPSQGQDSDANPQ